LAWGILGGRNFAEHMLESALDFFLIGERGKKTSFKKLCRRDGHTHG
jgi:hypothetical protein